MKIMIRILTLGILSLTALQAGARKTVHLQECWNRQVKPLSDEYLAFSYEEKLNRLYHSPEPWQQLNYTLSGTIWCNAGSFFKQDTLVRGQRTSYSKTEFDSAGLLYQDYGEKDLSVITRKMFREQVFETARYSPVFLINYFFRKGIPADKESDREFSVYKTAVDRAVVRLYIRRSDNLLDKITILEPDELRGDVLSTFTYRDYSSLGRLFYPEITRIEKINGRLMDEVRIVHADRTSSPPDLLERPADYKIAEDVVEQPRVTVKRHSDNIHFIDMQPAGARTMVVEFDSFLLVAESPRNSKNGELLISEARSIAPGKPIRYFAFSHHHPDYLGGMRPFIHKGATVLSVGDVKDYISYLANAPHTLEPDSLQVQPRPLRIEEIRDSITISDGKYGMKIYVIGKRSGHTKDFLVYYFPQEKLLFEGDLVWIEKEGGVKKAGTTQAGLYRAIQDLGLEVTTIVQSWGISSGRYKTIIPYEDLEQSMKIE